MDPATIAFYAALLLAALAVGPLAVFWRHPRPPNAAVKAGVSLSVFLFAWLGIELLLRAAVADDPDQEVVPVLGYEAARADPDAYRRWHNYRVEHFLKILGKAARPDPTGLLPYELIPDHTFVRHRSVVHINSLGFRGDDFDPDKGDRFRIVALGESTTFGLTILPDDRPWPELLEERIRDELACRAPVQVVNAGVPGWTLSNQVARLERDILPLRPDIVLSYHGYNGFSFFLTQLPSMRVHAAPTRPQRPSFLLEELEWKIRLAWFRRRYSDARALDPARIQVDPLHNPYAQHYLRLVEESRRGGAEPVLATFNMAVDEGSDEEVIRFYEATVPDLRARIVANQIHRQVVRAVGRARDVTVIDTSKGLDGAYRDAYVDIAHFTQAGRERMARNLLEGLRELLAERAGCRPRA